MIYMLAILPAERKEEPVAKCPTGALLRKTLIAHTTADVQKEVADLWEECRRDGPTPAGFYIQMDIIDGRKPTGFSATAKANELGENVVVTRKTRPAEKEVVK